MDWGWGGKSLWMSEYINSHQNPDALRCEWQRAAVDGTLSTLKQLIHHSAHSHTTAVTERRRTQRRFLSAETIALLKCADFALPFPFYTSRSDNYRTLRDVMEVQIRDFTWK